MISDPIILKLMSRLKTVAAERQRSFVTQPFDNLFQVGRIQGQVQGLEEAFQILEEILSESDERD